MSTDYTRPGASPWWERNPLAELRTLCPTCGTNLKDGPNVRPCPFGHEGAAA